jgi:hydroxymethylglutaryl-CoA reductase
MHHVDSAEAVAQAAAANGSSAAPDSRIPGFYRLPLASRREELLARAGLSSEDLRVLDAGGLDAAAADRLVENAVGIYALPLGLGLNFRINGADYLVPMAVEEPSVIAAASNAARMVRQGGGFHADADEPVMTAQVELVGVSDLPAARARIEAHAREILDLASAAVPRLLARGGGPRGLETRSTERVAGLPPRLVVHVHVDCRDAMGANLVNTVAEARTRRACPSRPSRPRARRATRSRPTSRRRPASRRTTRTGPPPTTRAS